MVRTAYVSTYIVAGLLLVAAPTIVHAAGLEGSRDGQTQTVSASEEGRAQPVAQKDSTAEDATGAFSLEIHDPGLWGSVGSEDRLLLFFVPSSGAPSGKTKAMLCSDLRVCGRRACDMRDGAGCASSSGAYPDEGHG